MRDGRADRQQEQRRDGRQQERTSESPGSKHGGILLLVDTPGILRMGRRPFNPELTRCRRHAASPPCRTNFIVEPQKPGDLLTIIARILSVRQRKPARMPVVYGEAGPAEGPQQSVAYVSARAGGRIRHPPRRVSRARHEFDHRRPRTNRFGVSLSVTASRGGREAPGPSSPQTRMEDLR